MSKKTSIAIIGAGMNGLALALSLRLFGLEATIYEQAEQPRAVGTGICIWPEGMQILAALCSVEKMRQIGNVATELATMTATGQLLNHMTVDAISPSNVAPMGMYYRGDIYNLLFNKLGKQSIKSNKKLINIDGTTLYFADGSEAKADIILGADGIFSKTRELIFPEAALKDSGVVCCRGMVDVDMEMINDKTVYVFSGQQSRIVTYTTDINLQQKYWFAAKASDGEFQLDNQESLQKHFGAYLPELQQMIVNTPQADRVASSLYELSPMKHWYKDNVALIGDACCAALPSMAIGFSLGLENSFILAQCIASNFFNVEKAFTRYQYRCLQRSNTLMQVTSELNEMVYKTTMVPEKVASLYQQFFATINQSPF